MKARYLDVLSAVMYFVCLIAFFCLLATDMTVLRLSHTGKIITAFIVFISGWCASVIKCTKARPEIKRIIMRRTVTLLFFAYLMIIIDFTLIDDSFGRNVSNIFLLSNDEVREYLLKNTNFIPFETVGLFIKGYKSGAVSLWVIMENLLGNFCVFMPMAFFMPMIFKSTRNFKDFLITISLAVILIELLQLIFLSGSGDIDDFLLNVLGAVTAYGIFKIPAVYRRLSAFTYGMWDSYEE